MKIKYLFLLSIFVFSISVSLSQIDSLVFDWSLNNFSHKPAHVKEGATISFIYKNINPFAVKSHTNGKSFDTDYNNGESVIQNILNINSKDSIKNSVTNKVLLDKQKEAISRNKDPKKISNALSSISKIKNDTTGTAIRNVSKTIGADSLSWRYSYMLMRLSEQKEDQKNEINRLIDKIKDQQSTIDALGLLDSTISGIIRDILISDKKQMVQRIAAITNDLKLSGTIDPEFLMHNIYKEFNRALDSINNLFDEIDKRLESLSSINAHMKGVLQKINIEDLYSFDDYLAALNNDIKNLYALYSDNNLLKMKNILVSIQYKWDNINNAIFRVCDKEIYVLRSDFIDISDTLLGVDNKTVCKIINPIRIKSTGGRRIDYSIGLALTFNMGFIGKTDAGINGSDYYLIRNDSNKVIGIGNNPHNKKYNFNPVAFVHYRWQGASPINFALSFGVNPDFNNLTSSKLMAGISLAGVATNNILRRIVLTSGFVAGYADCLKAKYADIKNYSTLNNLSDSDLTEKAIRLGGFFAISFNLNEPSDKSKSFKK